MAFALQTAPYRKREEFCGTCVTRMFLCVRFTFFYFIGVSSYLDGGGFDRNTREGFDKIDDGRSARRPFYG